MLHLFIERTGLIVLMILHQPSDEILEAMDSITVMMEGQIAFHQEDMMHFNPEAGQANYVHEILRRGSSNLADSSPNAGITEGGNVGSKSRDIPHRGIPKGLSIVQPSAFKSSRRLLSDTTRLTCLSDTIEQQERLESSSYTRVSVSQYLDGLHYHAISLRQRQSSLSLDPQDEEYAPQPTPTQRSCTFATITSRLEEIGSNAIYFIKQLPSILSKDVTLLWQVQPLLRRMQMQCGAPWLDFGVVLSVLVFAGWSQYASSFQFVMNGKCFGLE